MHGKDVVDQVAVNAAVSVLERMDVDKAEGEDCDGDDCIKVLRWALIERNSRNNFLKGVARQDIVGADRRPN
ncbi:MULTISPECIES: hypothetical protein [Mesorhizobium]|uniref:hypothetical protein n=1 Tax=Mesorhizobium TaxID=68287 RepID=UPI00068DD515|nr:hypothetical protein MesoLjLb_69630 [Mesorhizobium sp. L-8-3]